MDTSAWSDGDAVVVAAYIYPIKACGAMAVDALDIDRWGGAAGDRRWAVVDASDTVTWQGTHPRLAAIRPRPGAGGLLLEADGHPPLPLREDDARPPCGIALWNDAAGRHDRFEACCASEAADRWLAAVVGAPLRFVRLGEDAVDRPQAQRLHVVTLESAAEVDALLRSRGLPPADPLRYRPNLVLAGRGAALVPFVDDLLAAAEWPGGRIDVQAPCIRCVVPDVDPATGVAGHGVLDAMAELAGQRRPGGPVALGVYGRATPGARITRGQEMSLTFAF
ncbi:MAG: MOSC domain-containing protein [Burkholderiaceae bacterium]